MQIQMPEGCKLAFDEPLAKHTTLRVGGSAEYLVAPPNVEVMCECYRLCNRLGIPVRFLGRGSNLLCLERGVAGVVLSTTRCREIRVFGTTVIADAGVPLQSLITTMRRASLGGLEYLASVPGNVGGAIWANAGRGAAIGQSVADFVEEVVCWDGNREIRLSKTHCKFGYRQSTFMERPDLLITRVRFKFVRRSAVESTKLVSERLAYARSSHDMAKPNAGTVFKQGFVVSMKGTQRGSACFSSKTDNWIVNLGQASATDIALLLKDAEEAHQDRGLSNPTLEWAVW